MLDIGWWELMVVGMVALVVVGPKELPTLLRTIGRYVGMAKRQADEFRQQFDDALRESEFNDLRNEMNEITSDVASSVDDAQNSISKELSETDYDWDKEEAIKPAPEIAAEDDSTSFTLPDGEVVQKKGTESASAETGTGDAAAPDDTDAGTSANANANGSQSVDAAADAPKDTSDTSTPTPQRDAEAVR